MTQTQQYGVVGLLPARNAAADLDAYFASIARICDAVVALDDGSTDETAAMLEHQPLVKILLRNPPRDDYRGWDDAANRNRLLEAAGALDPEWIISLDADERIDAVDARALRRFLETDALPGCAYGFRHVPMRRDSETFWPRYQWIYRLFSYEPGQRFPDQRLHFIPVPTSIPRQRWVRTTLRVQHLGGMTDERRLIRFNKYLEADPTRRYQVSYSNVLMEPPPHELRQWQPRPADMPVLLDEAANPNVQMTSGADAPVLSAIIIARNDEATIARTVASVVNQDCPEPFEVILVTSGSDRTAEIVRREFPTVRVVELERPALPGEARNAGLAVARGLFVSFPGSHIELPPGSLAARMRAHRRGYAMVTGITRNGNTTSAGWASYFLDQHEGLPGHLPAQLNGPPAHCSYARLPLLEVGGFPANVRTAEDTAVNRALVRRGYVAFREPAIELVHRSPCRTLSQLLTHHFRRGRGWGRLLLQERRATGHVLTKDVVRSRLLRHLPARLDRIRANVAIAETSLAAEYDRVRLPIVFGAVSSWAGMWAEILKPAPGKLALLLDRPLRTVLIVGEGNDPSLILTRVDLLEGTAYGQRLPADLPVPVGTDKLTGLSSLIVANRPRGLETVRETIAAAINIPDLDVIVMSRERVDRLMRPESTIRLKRIEHSLPFRAIEAINLVVRGHLRSTIPVWMLGSVLRVLRRSDVLGS
ncbi:MAG TPA: glycosyltransferase [Thermomicrobiales bacterium]|nr:glycosyltransferase [Thermomicrobiales bacterium]